MRSLVSSDDRTSNKALEVSITYIVGKILNAIFERMVENKIIKNTHLKRTRRVYSNKIDFKN